MRTMIASMTLAAALAIGTGPIAGSAQAQQQPPQQQQPMPQQQPPAQQQVSDQDLQVFASALQEVQKIVVAYSPRIEKAKDPAQAQKLHTEAQQRMADAVEAEGLSVEQYNQVAKLAETDEGVRNRIKRYLGE